MKNLFARAEQAAGKYKILQLMEFKHEKKEMTNKYKEYEYLGNIGPDLIWDMYHEVFESDYAGDKLNFSQDSWVLYTDLKNRAYDSKFKQQED